MLSGYWFSILEEDDLPEVDWSMFDDGVLSDRCVTVLVSPSLGLLACLGGWLFGVGLVAAHSRHGVDLRLPLLLSIDDYRGICTVRDLHRDWLVSSSDIW
ncbi:hypothetical protein Dimus_006927 [Dionaea muscipula]